MYSNNLRGKAVRSGGDSHIINTGDKAPKPIINKPLTRKQAIRFIREHSPLSEWCAAKITDHFLDVFRARKDSFLHGVELKKGQAYFFPFNILQKLKELSENYKEL